MKRRTGENRIPWTGCCAVRTRDVSVLNPEEVGVSGVPVVGRCHARSVRDGADFHRHRYLEITVCERGSLKFDADGKVYSLLPGMAFVTQPGTVHRLRLNTRGSVRRWMFVRLPEKGGTFLGLTADESAVLAERLKALACGLYRIPDQVCPMLQELIDIIGCKGLDPVERRIRFHACALRFLLAVTDAKGVQEETRAESAVRAVIARMRREPEKAYPIDDLIGEIGKSESSIARAFKRETGHSPHEFLVICRIRKAMDVLSKDASVRITDLAFALGFSSSQYFAACFRRETGKSPTRWRDQGV